MKTSVKYFGLAVGPKARQHEPKWSKNCPSCLHTCYV